MQHKSLLLIFFYISDITLWIEVKWHLRAYVASVMEQLLLVSVDGKPSKGGLTSKCTLLTSLMF